MDRCLVSIVPASFIGSSGGGIAQVGRTGGDFDGWRHCIG